MSTLIHVVKTDKYINLDNVTWMNAWSTEGLGIGVDIFFAAPNSSDDITPSINPITLIGKEAEEFLDKLDGRVA